MNSPVQILDDENLPFKICDIDIAFQARLIEASRVCSLSLDEFCYNAIEEKLEKVERINTNG